MLACIYLLLCCYQLFLYNLSVRSIVQLSFYDHVAMILSLGYILFEAIVGEFVVFC